MSFLDMELSPAILQAVKQLNYTQPTEIQKQAIPAMLSLDKDFVGIAQTGTGKTAAFIIPLLEKMSLKHSNVQSLILSPTRELAMQIKEEFDKLASFTKHKSVVVYGGASYSQQINNLRKNKPQVVIGTPGRVLDFMKQGILDFQSAQYLVLDEADEMLNMGFFDDVQKILSVFATANEAERKIWMFSATMPQPILNLIQDSCKDPTVVRIGAKNTSNENIEQKYFLVKKIHFAEALYRVISKEKEDFYGIVFCRTRSETKELAENLLSRGLGVETLHGELNQSQRDLAMRRFKRKQVKILICTDVAARGLDVEALTHVFNYGLPQDCETYVHRIGCTGRAGSKGIAISLVDPSTVHLLKRIEIKLKKKIEPSKLPSVRDLKLALAQDKMAKVEKFLAADSVSNLPFSPQAETFALLSEKFRNFSHQDFIKFLYSWKFEEGFAHIDALGDLNEQLKPKATRGQKFAGKSRGRSTGFSLSDSSQSRKTSAKNTRLFLNIGRQDGIELKALIREVAKATGLRQGQIQNVSLKQSYSFIDIPTNRCQDILHLKQTKIKNRSIRFQRTHTPT
ncbi:MAG: DEAD/DEAH box helicase [Bdellovibrionota bacterium]